MLVTLHPAEDRKFVGLVPDGLHVAWATGTSLTRNPRFVRELEAKTGKEAVVLLLCRSGNRSAQAAEAAVKAGFTQVAASPEFVYVLGFSPQNLKLDGTYHALKVKLANSRGFDLQARRGYYAPKHLADPEDDAKLDEPP